jgi:quercetin dioxygenase-like cupin family protein
MTIMRPMRTKAAGGLMLAMVFAATTSCAMAQPITVARPAPPAAAAAAPSAGGAPAPVRRPMFETPLEGLQGHTGIMYITDFLPGASAARHQHPGYEFNYILQGAVTFMVDGQPPFTLKAGEGTYNPRDRIHAVKNASETEPAQLIAVLINDTGKPIALPVP